MWAAFVERSWPERAHRSSGPRRPSPPDGQADAGSKAEQHGMTATSGGSNRERTPGVSGAGQYNGPVSRERTPGASGAGQYSGAGGHWPYFFPCACASSWVWES